MARIRYIKPEFFLDDKLAELEPLVRILFAGLWVLADREGRLEYNPKKIKVQLLPYDKIDCDKALKELSDHQFIIRYEVGGKKYIQIVNFAKHQKPHHTERLSIIPAYVGSVTVNSPLKDGENPVGMGMGMGMGMGNGDGCADTPKAASKKRSHPPYLQLWFDAYRQTKAVAYAVSNWGEDTDHAKWCLAACGDDLILLGRVYRLYLMDNDKFIAKSGWSLRFLRQNFNGYFAKAKGVITPTANVQKIMGAMLPVEAENEKL